MRELADSFGGLKLPISTAAPGNEGLAGQDPARKVLLDLFAAAINYELGPIWTKVVAEFGTDHVLSGTQPVQYKLELAPNPNVLEQVKVAWPLLTLHREGAGEYDDFTLSIRRLTQQWQLNYILGPTSIEDIRRVGDATVMAAKVIDAVIRNRGHNAYDNGAAQFGAGKGSLSKVLLKSQEGPGQAALIGDEKNVLYYAITLNLETTELLEEDPEAYGPLDGASFAFGVGGGEGTINGLLYADTDSI